MTNRRWVWVGAAVAALAVVGCRPNGSWSPDSKALVLSAHGKLIRFDLSASKPVELQVGHSTQGHAINPAWSPDGKEVAFFSGAVKKDDVTKLSLHVLNLASKKVRVLVPTVAMHSAKKSEGFNIDLQNRLDLVREIFGIAWSPDSSRLAYTGVEGESPSLYVVNRSGGAPTPILPKGTEAAQPSWSPDGKRLAYFRILPGPEDSGPGPKECRVAVADPASRTSIDLAAPTAPQQFAGIGPAPVWSPDGSQILAVSGEPAAPNTGGQPKKEGPCAVWSVPVGGGPARKLTTLPPGSLMMMGSSQHGFAYLQGNEDSEQEKAFLEWWPVGAASPRRLATLTPATFGQPPKKSVNSDTFPVPMVSPDGKWVAVAPIFKEVTSSLILVPTAGGPLRRVPLPGAPTKKNAAKIRTR